MKIVKTAYMNHVAESCVFIQGTIRVHHEQDGVACFAESKDLVLDVAQKSCSWVDVVGVFAPVILNFTMESTTK